jgi:hypothetical protein
MLSNRSIIKLAENVIDLVDPVEDQDGSTEKGRMCCQDLHQG